MNYFILPIVLVAFLATPAFAHETGVDHSHEQIAITTAIVFSVLALSFYAYLRVRQKDKRL